jgi:hypothetical protein
MKPKTKTLLFILLSFVLGIFCGWFLEDRLFSGERHQLLKGPSEFLKVLTQRVHLNDRQVSQVDSILESKRKKMEIYKQYTLALRDSTRQDIRKILDSEQTKLFDGFIQEKDQRDAKNRDDQSLKK